MNSRLAQLALGEDTSLKLPKDSSSWRLLTGRPGRAAAPWHTPLRTPPAQGSPGYGSARCLREAGPHFLRQDPRSEALFSVGNLDNLLQVQYSLENLSQLPVKKEKKITPP